MKTLADEKAKLAKECEETAAYYRNLKNRYSPTSQHYHFNDGREMALMDMAKTLRDPDGDVTDWIGFDGGGR